MDVTKLNNESIDAAKARTARDSKLIALSDRELDGAIGGHHRHHKDESYGGIIPTGYDVQTNLAS
jgi:hypothetical protein